LSLATIGENNTAQSAQDREQLKGQALDTIHHNSSTSEILHGSGERILATTIQVSQIQYRQTTQTTGNNIPQQQRRETNLDPIIGSL